jgi:hypothetical protein
VAATANPDLARRASGGDYPLGSAEWIFSRDHAALTAVAAHLATGSSLQPGQLERARTLVAMWQSAVR